MWESDFVMNSYEENIQKIKETWQPPCDVQPRYIGYAFVHELIQLVFKHHAFFFCPTQLKEHAMKAGIDRNNISMRFLCELPSILQKYGIYEIREFIDYFEMVGVAFDIRFAYYDGICLHNVKIINKYDSLSAYTDYESMESRLDSDRDVISFTSTPNLKEDFYCSEWVPTEYKEESES